MESDFCSIDVQSHNPFRTSLSLRALVKVGRSELRPCLPFVRSHSERRSGHSSRMVSSAGLHSAPTLTHDSVYGRRFEALRRLDVSDLSQRNRRPWRIYLACIAGATILAVLIYAGHWPHILQAFPLLLVAACPLMHLFMHHGHGGHDKRGSS